MSDPTRLPPERVGLPASSPDLRRYADVDPAWSRLVEVADGSGVVHTWHVLDTHAQADPDEPVLGTRPDHVLGSQPDHVLGTRPDHVLGTMLCVHGNPTWSYLWRRFLAAAPAG